MFKRLLAIAFLALGLVSAHAAGTVSGFSLTPQFDQLGHVMPGCKLYVIQAGTVSTPQNSYTDTGLTSAQPNPLLCDNSGRLPQWFVADGQIKLRLTDKNGVQQFVGDNLLVVGPSSDGGGGGGGGQVDPTTIASTGQIKYQYGTGPLDGWVRLNGRTIGSATSGATERANSDTQALFEYLWGADSNLTVSGGRGASANADWVANKTITLPDARGRVLAGLDGMGNSTAGRLTSSYFGSDATVLGAANGSESETLTQAQLPAVKPTGTITNGAITISPATMNLITGSTNGQSGSDRGIPTFASNQPVTVSQASSTFTGDNLGSGDAHSIVQPTLLTTVYIKL